jgi:hypothetical protein
MVVCFFVVLFLTMLGVAWRRVASVLRVEQVVELRNDGDKGYLGAMARAMEILETRLRRNPSDGTSYLYVDDSDPTANHTTYTCQTSVNTDYYKVIFTRQSDETWTVSVAEATDSEKASLPMMNLTCASPPTFTTESSD